MVSSLATSTVAPTATAYRFDVRSIVAALNRPFMLFCRRCQDNMLTLDWTGTTEQLWAEAGRPVLLDLSATPSDGEQIAELSQLSGYRKPDAMLTMQFTDGLLAIHQAGSYLALLHPFRDVLGGGGGDEMPLFVREDPIRCPSDCRAFPPTRMADHRHLLFSTPRAVYALNAWSLRDWASHSERERFHVLVDCSAAGSPGIACPPTPLDSKHVGLVTRRSDGVYLWTILNLPDLISGEPVRGQAESSVTLPLTGDTCHVERVRDCVLVFATTEGHWAWRPEDAIAGESKKMVRTWPANPGSERLVPNSHEEEARNFHSLRHFLAFDRSPKVESVGKFTWYFQRQGHPVNPLECYDVDCESLQPSYTTTLDGVAGSAPYGSYIHGRADNAPTRILFCSGRRLCYEAGLDLRPLEGHGQVEDTEHLQGAIFCDPALIEIGHGQATRQRVTIRSLQHPNQQMAMHLPAIHADPLIWSHWLFTIEVGENHSLTLNRRNLQPLVLRG